MVTYFLTLALALFSYMTLWFVISILKKRNDLADVAWGLGFVFMSWFSLFLGSPKPISSLVCLLVTIWGLRLSLHIYRRNHGKPEDSRYATWRKEWKHFYLQSYLQVFLLQGFLLFLISLPIFFLNFHRTGDSSLLLVLGFITWLFGFTFEAVSDWQLKQFIQNPQNNGKIMNQGLWHYSRHPNYFGEVTLWWGIFLISFSQTSNLFSILGPLTISTLILFVSGIPLLEKKYQGRPEYEEYKKSTSVFFPLPPGK